MNQQLINGATLLGTSLTMFGIGFILPEIWQKRSMFFSGFVFLGFSMIAFFEKDKIERQI